MTRSEQSSPSRLRAGLAISAGGFIPRRLQPRPPPVPPAVPRARDLVAAGVRAHASRPFPATPPRITPRDVQRVAPHGRGSSNRSMSTTWAMAASQWPGNKIPRLTQASPVNRAAAHTNEPACSRLRRLSRGIHSPAAAAAPASSSSRSSKSTGPCRGGSSRARITPFPRTAAAHHAALRATRGAARARHFQPISSVTRERTGRGPPRRPCPRIGKCLAPTRHADTDVPSEPSSHLGLPTSLRPQTPQITKGTKDPITNHEPHRTARTEKKAVLGGLLRRPRLKLTYHADCGPAA